MSRLDSKVVAITGASSGIGAATALELAARGAAVVLGARRTDRLDSLAARIRAEGGRAEMLEVDVTRRADLEQLVALAVNQVQANRLDRCQERIRRMDDAIIGLCHPCQNQNAEHENFHHSRTFSLDMTLVKGPQ